MISTKRHTMTAGEAGIEFRSRLPGVRGYGRGCLLKMFRSGKAPASKFDGEWVVLSDWVNGEITDRLMELDDLIRQRMINLAHSSPILWRRRVSSVYWTAAIVDRQTQMRILERISDDGQE